MNTYIRYLLAAIAGALYCAAFVGFDQWYFAWICLVPLLFALEGVPPKQGFLLGLTFGTVALTAGFYWITYTIHVFANMPWVVSGIGCILLSAAQGTQFAIFGLLYVWLRKRTGWSPLIIGTTTFVATEFVCPQLFPHYFANSQYMQIPLIQICDITGVLGLTAVLVFVNACIYLIIRDLLYQRHLRWSLILTILGTLSIVLAYGYVRLPTIKAEMEKAPKLRFGIAQANLGIREKNRYPERSIRLNQEQTLKLKEQGADIVVWPETAAQEPILSPGAKILPTAIFDDLDVPILTGLFQYGYDDGHLRVYNSAALTDKEGRILGIYKKQKLLMLGEYIPLGESYPKLYDWFPYIGRLTPGNSNEPLRFGDYILNVNICYEEILPRLMRRMIAYSPNVMINITNDNWFGRTAEPIQHLVLAAFRSVEHRMWLVRSTNTGISAFVDATGKILEQSPLMEKSTLIRDVPMMSSKTIYTRFGDWMGWLAVSLIIIAAITTTLRNNLSNKR